jgi:Ca-activated chloride channel homolog
MNFSKLYSQVRIPNVEFSVMVICTMPVYKTCIAVLLCLSVFSAAGVVAQQKTPPNPPAAQERNSQSPPPQSSSDDDRESLTIEVVNVSLPVTVLDSDGRFIGGLKQKDFQILENRTPQSIVAFQKRDGLPLNVALLMDTSTSIRNRLEFEKQATTEFLQKFLDNRRDRVSLTTFDDEVNIRSPFTNNFVLVEQAVRGVVKADGQTALYDAIKKVCLEQMPSANSKRRAILILTDGGDTASGTSLDQAIAVAQKAEVAIYAISTKGGGVFRVEGNPYRNLDDRDLKRLCKETGGDVFFPSGISQLKRAFELAEEYLRNQYFLVYEPSDGARNRTFRRIEVHVSGHKNARVLTRSGYFSE